MTATILARAARAASGLSQSELSRRSGIAGSSLSLIENGKRDPTVSTLEALLNNTQHILVTIPTLRADAARIADQISAALADASTSDAAPVNTALANTSLANTAFGSVEVANTAHAFRRFIQLADNLAAEAGATRVGLTLTEPAPTGSAHWDAAIAALCEYRLNADALPVPEWITAQVGNPDEPWQPKTTRYNILADQAEVPPEFLRRGILIEAATLVSI
ncbi:helix-turn-helix domain-containing protein [Cryobacterium sp. TMT1-66-1]|uniref:helix-turn-helix domain-containing protein n=1 Tax=Cryobacterium sp. TMT1-66-1 TaxID=1259242 RepID=UPI00106CB2C6|nr:helix-turn-helix transcriptional regulator [Cryobacterium sp. TMT1-66-1]TFD07524.1 XRE family transcriptional regulator [Cryobacterium sp. TMT1-66-1]